MLTYCVVLPVDDVMRYVCVFINALSVYVDILLVNHSPVLRYALVLPVLVDIVIQLLIVMIEM